ncbi:MAG: sulfite exporter TauE/SafE family protein [Acidobacteriota bacterium]
MFLEVATTFGALAGAFLGVLMKGWVLSLVFSGIMFLIGFVSFRERGSEDREDADGNGVVPDRLSRYMELGGAYYDRAKDREVQYKATRSLQGSGAALMAGLGSGMLGIGGGVIKVAALNTVMRVPIKASVATSKFMIGITAATAAVVYFLADAVNLCVVAPVALGAVVGAVAGSHLMNRLKSRLLKTIFALLLFYMAYEMLGRALLHGFRLHLPGLM